MSSISDKTFLIFIVFDIGTDSKVGKSRHDQDKENKAIETQLDRQPEKVIAAFEIISRI